MADILCFGDLLIDFVPLESGLPLADVPAFKKAPGGAAANVAVGLSRLGVKSAFMGKVGDDPFGHFLKRTLDDEGIDTSPMRLDNRARTALAFVTLEASGERDFLFYRHPSADMLFVPDEVDKAAIGAASIFHFDSISLAAAQPRETALFAADHARSLGRTISYDVNLRLPLWGSADEARDGIREGLARAHVAKLSDDELDFMTQRRDPAAVRDHLWHDGLKLAVLSLGARGSVLLTADHEEHVPSVSVTPVDTTGAGDGFVAGLLAAIHNDPDIFNERQKLVSAVRFANAVGALTTTGRGAIPALPGRERVEAALRQG
ncbi:MAG: fructokinase [Geminicoccaceae bacterium]|nr:fructokinase [Geminicoccaceae bacterium]